MHPEGKVRIMSDDYRVLVVADGYILYLRSGPDDS